MTKFYFSYYDGSILKDSPYSYYTLVDWVSRCWYLTVVFDLPWLFLSFLSASGNSIYNWLIFLHFMQFHAISLSVNSRLSGTTEKLNEPTTQVPPPPPQHRLCGGNVSQFYDEITIVSHNSITARQRLLNSSDKAFPACATTQCVELVFPSKTEIIRTHLLETSSGH